MWVNRACRTKEFSPVRFILRRWTWTGDFKCREVKTGFCRNRSMQTGSSGTLIGWKSGQTTFVPLWDWMEGAWLRTLGNFVSETEHAGLNYSPSPSPIARALLPANHVSELRVHVKTFPGTAHPGKFCVQNRACRTKASAPLLINGALLPQILRVNRACRTKST